MHAAEATARVAELWTALEHELRTHAAEVAADLKGPASEDELTKLRLVTGGNAPELYASYAIHNGQQSWGHPLFDPWKLLDIEEIFANVETMQEVIVLWAAEGIRADDIRDETIAGVRPDTWHEGWIPVAENGLGDLLCIDMAPDDGGVLGQIIEWQHEDASRAVVAHSFSALLRQLLDSFPNGDRREQPGSHH